MWNILMGFGLGVLTGGLSLSTCWGLFWLTIGMMGFSRGACSWRVLGNSFAATLASVLLTWTVFWMRGEVSALSGPFVAGVSVMPLALVGLGLRSAPDGRRIGAHMIKAVRHQISELLDQHHDCGGCQDEEPHKAEG